MGCHRLPIQALACGAGLYIRAGKGRPLEGYVARQIYDFAHARIEERAWDRPGKPNQERFRPQVRNGECSSIQ